MKVARLIVRGEDVTSLVGLLRPRLENAYLDGSDGVSLLASEKYYLRTNSMLLSVVVLDCRLAQTCTLEVISGGGGAGMLDLDWGAENNRNNELIRFIEAICKQRSWVLEKVQTP